MEAGGPKSQSHTTGHKSKGPPKWFLNDDWAMLQSQQPLLAPEDSNLGEIFLDQPVANQNFSQHCDSA